MKNTASHHPCHNFHWSEIPPPNINTTVYWWRINLPPYLPHFTDEESTSHHIYHIWLITNPPNLPQFTNENPNLPPYLSHFTDEEYNIPPYLPQFKKIKKPQPPTIFSTVHWWKTASHHIFHSSLMMNITSHHTKHISLMKKICSLPTYWPQFLDAPTILTTFSDEEHMQPPNILTTVYWRRTQTAILFNTV